MIPIYEQIVTLFIHVRHYFSSSWYKNAHHNEIKTTRLGKTVYDFQVRLQGIYLYRTGGTSHC